MTQAGELQVTTPEDRLVVMTRSFDAPRTLIFRAFTEPELVKRWLWAKEWPMTECRIDLRIGGTLRYVWTFADGREMGLSGTYREIDAPVRLVHTEVFDKDWTGGESKVTTSFDEAGGKTTVRMGVLYATAEVRNAVMQTGMAEGVAEAYLRLASLIGENALV